MLDKILSFIAGVAKQPLIIHKYRTGNLNYPANNGQSRAVELPTITGYTPMCVVGWETYSWYVTITRAFVANGYLYWTARNVTASQVSNWTDIYIMYIRDELLR